MFLKDGMPGQDGSNGAYKVSLDMFMWIQQGVEEAFAGL